MVKKKRHAIKAPPRAVPAVGKRRKLTLPATAAAGEQLGREFKAVGERIAAREAKLTAEFDPKHAERRAGTIYSVHQLSEETVQLIGQQFQAGELTVKALAEQHHIHPTTIYELAAKRGWPKRSLVAAAQQRLAASMDPATVQAAIDRINGGEVDALATHDAAELQGNSSDSPSSDDHSALSDRQNLSRAQIADQAGRDELLESYALACTEVLGLHRDLSKKVVEGAQSILDVFNAAIAQAREQFKHDARACAKVMSGLAKEYHALVGTMQKAMDMQRQAYALDEGAGKGMGPEHMQLMRAMRAGMVRPDQLAALPPPPQQQGAGNGMPPRANAPLVIDGSYEELVREGERRGVRFQ